MVMQQCDDLTVSADSRTVVTDFEQAAINAVANVLGPQVEVRGCFSTCARAHGEKNQDLGLAQSYCDSEDVKHFCCMVDALAFLSVDQVSDGIQYLFSDAPEENHDTLIELLTYFDATYVTATARQIHRQGDASNTISVRRIPPLFEPRKQNIHEATIRTLTAQTICAMLSTISSAVQIHRSGPFYKPCSVTSLWLQSLSSATSAVNLQSREPSDP